MSKQREMKDAQDIWLRHLSLFSDRGDSYAEYDTAEAFVVAWLEAEADSKEWKAKELAAQQMSLF